MRILPEVIENLFFNELSAHNWTKYTTTMIKEIITVKYAMKNPVSNLELKLLMKKLKDTLPMSETLAILTDEMMGKLQE